MKAYFFPGLGADASLEPYHRISGLDAQWIKWPSIIRPNWELFLSDLIGENEIEEGSLFLGISFGGLVATQVAVKIRPAGIVLIGSLTSPTAITSLLTPFRHLLTIIPDRLFNLAWVPDWVIAYFFGIRKKEHLLHFFRMARSYTPSQTKALIQLALSASSVEKGYPLYVIHGDKDRILPAQKCEADLLIKGGGHLLSMTHSDEVNEAILKWAKSQRLLLE
jgi:pimeloyl-ACP methyl ester carboxylesterase